MTPTEANRLRHLKELASEFLADRANSEGGILSAVLATDERYGQFLEDVISHPSDHCLREQQKVVRILKLCRRKGVGFAMEKAREVIAIMEQLFFRQDAKYGHITLTPYQVFDIVNVYGFLTKAEDGQPVRLFQRFVAEIPRKVGKSTQTAGLAVVEALTGPYNTEVYVASNTYKQAQICFGMIKDALQKLDIPGLRLKIKINREKCWVSVYRKEGKDWKQTQAATIECVTNPDALDGPNPSVFIIDELAAAKTTATQSGYAMRKVLRSGQVLRREPLEIDITTASSVIGGEFHTEVEQSFRPTLDAAVDDTEDKHWRTYLSIYEPDVDDEEGDPHTWQKVNPHYALFAVVRDYYRQAWADAQGNAEMMLEFRTKQLNIFCLNESKSWHSAEDVMLRLYRGWDGIIGNEFFKGKQCIASFDLSDVNDLTAFGYAFFLNETHQFAVFTEYFFPEGQMEQCPNRELYSRWAEEGYLQLIPGDVIDSTYLTNRLLEHARWVDIRRIAFDANKAATIRNNLVAAGYEKKLFPFWQSKGSYNPAIQIVDTTFATKVEIEQDTPPYQLFFSDNPILPWCFGNSIIEEDSHQYRMPVKGRGINGKIDGAVTVAMAIGTIYKLRNSK